MSDLLAKSQTIDAPCIQLSLSKQEIIHQLDIHYEKFWTKSSQDDKTSTHLSNIGYWDIPKIKYLKPRSNEILYHRLRLNNCNLDYYLHKINLSDSPLCEHCSVIEDIDHFLLHCSRNYELTDLLKKVCMDNNIPYSSKYIINNLRTIRIIYRYTRKKGINL